MKTAEPIYMCRQLPDYGNFVLSFLGYNFLNTRSGKILSKRQFYELEDTSDSYEIVPYEPPGGWEGDSSRQEHFNMVDRIRKENDIPSIDDIIDNKYVFWAGWLNRRRPGWDRDKVINKLNTDDYERIED